jgi:hypothetical protein
MCGRTSGNLLVIDCETNERFADQIRQVREWDIPLFTVKTARGGHIWLRCAEGEVKNLSLGELEELLRLCDELQSIGRMEMPFDPPGVLRNVRFNVTIELLDDKEAQ